MSSNAEDNRFPYITGAEVAADGSATPTPPAGHRAIFMGDDGVAYQKNDADVVSELGSGSGTAFSGAKVYKTAQAISNAILTFDTELWDTDGYHEGVTHPSRLTAPSTGKYLAEFNSWTSRTDARAQIFVNGSMVRGGNGRPSTGNYTGALAVLDLTAGDYVEINGVTVASTTFGDNGVIGDNSVFSLTKL
jgi:hypothetical protein